MCPVPSAISKHAWSKVRKSSCTRTHRISASTATAISISTTRHLSHPLRYFLHNSCEQSYNQGDIRRGKLRIAHRSAKKLENKGKNEKVTPLVLHCDGQPSAA